MPGPADILREIHRLRRHVQELHEKITGAPRALKTQQQRLANQEAALKQAQDALKHLKVKIHENDVSIRAAQQQAQKYEKQLKEMITSKKEYDALTAEIKQARETIARLEDETLVLIEESETKAAQLVEVEKGVQKARAEYAQYEKDQQERLARYAVEKEKAAAELKGVEATLPEDVRVQYAQLVAVRGADSLAGVGGRVCNECYTEITPQMSNDLARGNFIICKNCGRMLYADN